MKGLSLQEHSLVLFVVLSSWQQWTIFTDASTSCPNECSCGRSQLDCRGQQLIEVPIGIPTNVRDVDLSNNRISVIRNSSFLGLVNLQILNLGGNDLKVIEIAAFYYLSSLQSLDLSDNGIQELTARHFYHLPNLSKLSITRNSRLNVSVSAFQNLGSVTEIIADGNLHSDDYDFSDISSLEVLRLSDCKVRRFYADNFRSLPSLTTLTLSDNELMKFPSDILDDMAKLETLNLAGNLITDLQKYNFNKNPKLKLLDISKNDVESLEGVRFTNLTNLSLVDLRFNKIKVLPEGLLGGLILTSRLTVKVDENPIVCDCRIKWLSQLGRLTISVEAKCVSPKSLEGLDAASVPHNRLFCAPSERDGAALSSVVNYGDPVTLACPVTGDPFPSITWMYHNQSAALNTPVSTSFVRASIYGDKLFYEAVNFDKAGIYICKADNKLGSVKVTLVLSVVPLAAAKQQVIVSSCHTPVFLITLLFTVVLIAAGVSFVLYRKFLKAVRAQQNMDYATLREPEGEAL